MTAKFYGLVFVFLAAAICGIGCTQYRKIDRIENNRYAMEVLDIFDGYLAICNASPDGSLDCIKGSPGDPFNTGFGKEN